MSDKSKIEWTDATWNPITGCSVVSPGCTNCYAMRLAGTRLRHHWSREGLTTPSKAGPVWNGEVRFNQEWLDQPLRWKRPRRIFVCAHGDLFHESVTTPWLDAVFAVMAFSEKHQFQVLTKRQDRMQQYINGGWWERFRHNLTRHKSKLGIDDADWLFRTVQYPLRNVWVGTSVEDRARKTRIDTLQGINAEVRFLSLEPLIGDLGELDLCGIDWVIVGGESGSNARPMHPDWARSIRDQCVKAGVAFHFKQWGEWVEVDGPRCRSIRQNKHLSDSWIEPDGTLHPRSYRTDRLFGVYGTSVVRRVGKKRAGRELDGRTWDEMPREVS